MTPTEEKYFHVLFESAPVFWRKPPMSWKPEITTAVTDDHGWASNALRFATQQEALDYVADLAYRWTAVKHTRVVACDDPVSHMFTKDSGAQALPEAEISLEHLLAPGPPPVSDKASFVGTSRDRLRQIGDELEAAAGRAYGEPPTVRLAATRLRDYVRDLDEIARFLDDLDRLNGDALSHV